MYFCWVLQLAHSLEEWEAFTFLSEEDLLDLLLFLELEKDCTPKTLDYFEITCPCLSDIYIPEEDYL